MRHDPRYARNDGRSGSPEGGRGGRGRFAGGRFGPFGPGGPRGREQEVPPADGVEGWFAGRLPEGWFEGTPQVSVDRDEILVVGRVPAPEKAVHEARTHEAGVNEAGVNEAAKEADVSEAEAGRISRFREQTREERIAIAREAEHRYGRKVSWGAAAGDSRELFTTLSVPVMTRLRQPERQVLDTLVEAGVARSRSDALVWSVRLVGEHSSEWLTELREALTSVQRVREQGPS